MIMNNDNMFARNGGLVRNEAIFYEEDPESHFDRAVRNAHTLYVLHTHLIAKMARFGSSQLAMMSPFWLKESPPISHVDFADRLGTYLNCSPEAFIVAAEYMTRLFEVQPMLFHVKTAHKLYLALSVIAAKWTDDRFFSTSFYADIGGVPPQQMSLVEREAADHLRFGFFVSSAQFLAMRDRMETIRTMTVPADLTVRAGGGVAAAIDHTRTAQEKVSEMDIIAERKNEDLHRVDAEFSMEMSPFSPNIDDFISTERFGSPEVHRSVVRSGSSSRDRQVRTRGGLVKAPSVRAAVAANPESLHLGTGGRRASWYGELPSLEESPTKKRRHYDSLEEEEVTRGISKKSKDTFADDDDEDDLEIVNVPAAKRTCYAPVLRCSERPTIPANIKSLSLMC